MCGYASSCTRGMGHAVVPVGKSENNFWESVLPFCSFARQFWSFLPRDHVHWENWPTSFLVSLCLHLPSCLGSQLGIRMLAITSCFLCGSWGLNPDGQALKASAFTAEPSFQPLGVCYMPSTVLSVSCVVPTTSLQERIYQVPFDRIF